MTLDRAYARLEVKTIDAPRRRFSGIASTPELDRQGEMIDPAGVTFRNPIPLLLYHDQKRPIGTATLTRRADGRIAFDAELPYVDEPGTLKDRIDEAWQSVRAGLLRGVSIGHRIATNGIRAIAAGAREITATEICELSLVTIPANQSATILTIKSLACAPAPKERPVMKLTIGEHITALENKRAALAARQLEIMEGAANDEKTLEPEQDEEWKALDVQRKAVEADLVKWREHEKLTAAAATPVVVTPPAPRLPVISVKANVPIGTAFVRLACAKLVCNGNLHEAAEYAKRWDDSTPEVALSLKAAIAPGTTTDPAWAAPLVTPAIGSEFLELLRPATILGKIPNWRKVPFNTKVPAQTAGGTYGWVGESKPKPVTALAFTSQTLGFAKAAGIIVLTDELVRLSNPAAEDLARRDMIAGIAQFLDAQLINPAVAAVAGVNPASITNGAPTAAATTNPLADILGLIGHFTTNNIDVAGLTFILSPANALALAFRTNADGSPQFPGVSASGGEYKGMRFVASNAAANLVIAVQPDLVLYADDGQTVIDVSREASLQMDSAPMSPADATTVFVSLWQTNNVGLRAERWINWLRANANAVKYLTAATWPAPTIAAAEAPAA